MKAQSTLLRAIFGLVLVSQFCIAIPKKNIRKKENIKKSKKKVAKPKPKKTKAKKLNAKKEHDIRNGWIRFNSDAFKSIANKAGISLPQEEESAKVEFVKNTDTRDPQWQPTHFIYYTTPQKRLKFAGFKLTPQGTPAPRGGPGKQNAESHGYIHAGKFRGPVNEFRLFYSEKDQS